MIPDLKISIAFIYSMVSTLHSRQCLLDIIDNLYAEKKCFKKSKTFFMHQNFLKKKKYFSHQPSQA